METQPFGDKADSPELKQLHLLLKQQSNIFSEYAIDIVGLPWGSEAMGRDYPELQKRIQANPTMIRRFAFRRDMDIFKLVARPDEIRGWWKIWMLRIAMFLGFVTLAVWASSWFLLGLLLVPFTANSGRRIDTIILRAASRSERAFCILLYTNQISVLVGHLNYYWEESQGRANFEDLGSSFPDSRPTTL
jgi:hypothetical protein